MPADFAHARVAWHHLRSAFVIRAELDTPLRSVACSYAKGKTLLIGTHSTTVAFVFHCHPEEPQYEEEHSGACSVALVTG